MDDREYADTKARVQRYLAWWQKELGLRWWTFDYGWQREPAPGDGQDPYVLGAQTIASWEYLRAKLVFWLPHLCTQTDEEIERLVIHECMHVLLNEMREYEPRRGGKHEERVAETLTDAFLWVRNQARDEVTTAQLLVWNG